ncbi:MFS transporter [Pseudonocardia humida]|uniref:MFS transporter n=1 Tax=Pseudonocardia humida TaxID=2800819 RepID=UPI002112C42E|nr:MFS transporter [Pseudonocardia humida]
MAAGVLAAVATAASAATGVVAGLLVDRVDRRTVSVVSDLLATASIAALPIVDVLWGLDMTWFLTLAVVGAVVRVPGMTAQETLLPALARLGPAGPGRLDRLVATRETVGNTLLPAGPGLGGLLVAGLGLTPALLLATAATSLLAALTTLLLDPRSGRVPERGRAATGAGGAVRRAGADPWTSWRFLARNRLVLGATLITAMLIAVISSLQSTLMPAHFTAQDLPALTGLTLSAIAAGSIAGSALYAATAGRVSRRTWFVIGMAGLTVGFAGVGSLASPWLVLAGAALVGLTNAPAAAILGVLTIEATPDAMRGRVLGAQNTVMLAAPALTSAPLAAVAAVAGLPVAGALLAGLAAVTAIVALAAPAFRSLDAPARAMPIPESAIGVVGAGPSRPDTDPARRCRADDVPGNQARHPTDVQTPAPP